MDQSMRLHKARRDSSEWLISDKISRRGLELKEDVFAPKKSRKNRVCFPFSVDPVLLDPSYFEWHYSVGNPMSWDGFNPVIDDQLTHSLYVKKGLNKFITSTGYFQYNDRHSLLGNELYVSTPFGSVFVNNALKQTEGLSKLAGTPKASFVTYPIYSSPDQWFKLMNFGISGSVRTPRFLPFGAPRPDLHDNLLFEYSGTVSYQLMHFFFGNISIHRNQIINGK